MKITEKKKPINTIPEGVWEGSRPVQNEKKKRNGKLSPSTDLQGNGYPSDFHPSNIASDSPQHSSDF